MTEEEVKFRYRFFSLADHTWREVDLSDREMSELIDEMSPRNASAEPPLPSGASEIKKEEGSEG
jgi:hypothetical protein